MEYQPRDEPHRRKLLQLVGLSGLGLLAPATLPGCGGADTTTQLRQLLLARRQERCAGGLTLQMLTASGDNFASTLEGVTAGCHFRAASATPADLARWIRCQLRGAAGIGLAQVARMCQLMLPNAYGLGITRRLVNDQELGFGHNGGTGGYLTDVYHDSRMDLSFVLQSSLIDFDDPLGEMQWLGAIEVDAHCLWRPLLQAHYRCCRVAAAPIHW